LGDKDEINQSDPESLAGGAGPDPDLDTTAQQGVPETESGLANGGNVGKGDDGSKNEEGPQNPNGSEDEDETAKRYPRRTQQPTSLDDTGLPPLLANMGWGGKQIKVTIRIEGGSLETSSPSLLGGSPRRLGGRGGRGRGGRGRECLSCAV
jgi:hypothetical protein